ncbi:MAG: hypothetical protein ACYTDU_00160 [Planctomycetota bacterium]|jgi:hypothetical protein
MKQTLLVAAASAAIGAATAIFLTHPAAPPARGPAPARLSTVDLEVAFVRALETSGLGRQPPSRPVAAPSAPSAPGRATDEAATPIRSADGKESLPAPNLPELEVLKSFDDDPELRRAWMFRPAREVLAWLGSPERAFTDQGGERWVYTLSDGKERVLEFHRGRLLNIFD